MHWQSSEFVCGLTSGTIQSSEKGISRKERRATERAALPDGRKLIGVGIGIGIDDAGKRSYPRVTERRSFFSGWLACIGNLRICLRIGHPQFAAFSLW